MANRLTRRASALRYHVVAAGGRSHGLPIGLEAEKASSTAEWHAHCDVAPRSGTTTPHG